MARRSNKWIADTLTPSVSLTANISATKIDTSSAFIRNNDDALLERKITLATEGFTTHKYCELVLKDRIRLSKENACVGMQQEKICNSQRTYDQHRKSSCCNSTFAAKYKA
jgi:hypothetical protein